MTFDKVIFDIETTMTTDKIWCIVCKHKDTYYQFKEDIKNIGKVVDYDFPNVITECKSCFGDPIHTTDSVSTVIINDLFSDSLTIGKELH